MPPRDDGTGPLRLVIDPLVAEGWLDERLGDFRERNPTIELAVSRDERAPAAGAEVAAVLIGTGRWGDRKSELLLDLADFAVAHRSLLEEGGGLSHATELARFTLLHAGSTEAWQHWLTAAGVTDVDVSRGPVFDSTADCLAAAGRGEGVALANELSAGRQLREGSLVKALPNRVPSRQGVYLVTAKDAGERPGVAALRGWLHRELRRRAAA